MSESEEAKVAAEELAKAEELASKSVTEGNQESTQAPAVELPEESLDNESPATPPDEDKG